MFSKLDLRSGMWDPFALLPSKAVHWLTKEKPRLKNNKNLRDLIKKEKSTIRYPRLLSRQEPVSFNNLKLELVRYKVIMSMSYFQTQKCL